MTTGTFFSSSPRWVIGLVLATAALLSSLPGSAVTAFSVLPSTTGTAWLLNTQADQAEISLSSTSSSALYSSNPPPRRKARRNLQKRRRKKKKSGGTFESSSEVISTSSSSSSSTGTTADTQEDTIVEIRPLISATAKEAGEDYWIDQEELKRAQERKEQIRKREPGQVPDEKLWTEVLSPYKQNWIGIFSVVIVILATIVTQFPELLQSPVIGIPDL